MAKKKKKIIGRSETVHFPELGLESVTAKVDTGAYGSTIHCASASICDDGRLKIIFAAEEYGLGFDHEVLFEDFRKKNIVSSNGQSEERYVVDTNVILGKKTREITLSFTNREKMRHPVLIGRLFLKKHRLLVNPRVRNTFSKSKTK